MSATDVEIIDFSRPEGNRKNLFITNIPGGSLTADDVAVKLHSIFECYGLIHGVQVYPVQWKQKRDTGEQENTNSITDGGNGFYAFVRFYSFMAAARAKDDLNSVVMLADSECKIAYAKRQKGVEGKQDLYVSRCFELVSYYLGYNSWSTDIKTLFEDTDSITDQGDTRTVKYVCLVDLQVRDVHTDGVGVWQETYNKTDLLEMVDFDTGEKEMRGAISSDPMSKIQAVCKCKKLCHHRAIENAFSKVLLVLLGNGKVTVEIDTTKPDFHPHNAVCEDQLVKINELDVQPDSEALDIEKSVDVSNMSTDAVDDLNLHLLQELEDDM